jgi:uncharacterized membrane protein (DUF373 family)
MLEIINKIEKVIYAALMFMLIVVLIAAMADLAYILVTSLTNISPWLLESHEMITVLGGFLLVLIGVELLETIKAYFRENSVHVEIVVLLAIIAIARKVILFDPTDMTASEYGLQLIGTGVLVAGLAAGYYMIKKAGISVGSFHDEEKLK